MQIEEKHYLDSSVFVKLFSGTTKYKRYLKSSLQNSRCYVTPYVRMELTRGWLIPLMDFYTVLEMSDSLSDAMKLWTNDFSKRRLAVISNYASDLLADSNIYTGQNKEESLKSLALYIRRLEMFIRRNYRDPGNDSTHCPKPKISLPPRPESLSQEGDLFNFFNEAFSDDDKCRSQCKISGFILNRHKSDVDLMLGISTSSAMKGNKSEGRGFLVICQVLTKLIEKGEKGFTCRTCGKIGDAAIAILSPSDMQIEHTDKSFDFICHAIQKPHRRLSSETAVEKEFHSSQSE